MSKQKEEWDNIYFDILNLRKNHRYEEINDYLLNYLDETNHGTLRTLLISTKQVKDHPSIKDTAEILADKLKKILGVEKI
ncbi:MAG: hypothetical protein SLAVMIC_00331 [uncultured marine phage]|uniref:Uncharacterized protein n=1 Tax=uncultured marine phage TaxID=707152 RepID=A0A8D9CBX1_9VIRU|nr:MAG: hypothetical protein SLAVMIC_00331 [uncultured marine phage]